MMLRELLTGSVVLLAVFASLPSFAAICDRNSTTDVERAFQIKLKVVNRREVVSQNDEMFMLCMLETTSDKQFFRQRLQENRRDAANAAPSDRVSAPAPLPRALAQKALERWAGMRNQFHPKVIGVVDWPGDSMALVDFHIRHFSYDPNDPLKQFSGNMQATFRRYTDGRWLLVEIRSPVGKFPGENIIVK